MFIIITNISNVGSFTYIPDRQKILLFGGFSTVNEPLADVWELDIRQTKSWFKRLNFVHFSEYFEAEENVPGVILSTRNYPTPRWSTVPPIIHLLPPRLWHSYHFVSLFLSIYCFSHCFNGRVQSSINQDLSRHLI